MATRLPQVFLISDVVLELSDASARLGYRLKLINLLIYGMLAPVCFYGVLGRRQRGNPSNKE
jgi:hypothetical protein